MPIGSLAVVSPLHNLHYRGEGPQDQTRCLKIFQ